MEAFYTTIGIVGGILIPFIAVGLLFLIGYIFIGLLEYWKVSKEYKVEKLKKQAPYDEVETSMDVPNHALKVRFYKDSELVWESTLSDRELRGSK